MSDWINPVSTLIASFTGAWVAFKLQSREKAGDLRRANIGAANKTLLTMMQQANIIKMYQLDNIDPHRKNPGRHFTIKPTLPFDLDTLRFDFGSLSFFDTPNEQQLLFELSIQERRFIETLRAVNARSELLLSEIQPKLNAAGILDGGTYEGKEFQAAIGQPLYNMLERLTSDVIYHTDRTSDSIDEMKNKFLSAAHARYPGIKFIDFIFPNIN